MEHAHAGHFLFHLVLFCLTYSSVAGTDLELRLYGERNATEGRVEVRRAGGVWGGICNNDFDSRDATVVCRQLKKGTNGMVMKNNRRWKLPENMYLDKMECVGNESSIEFCRHGGWGDYSCRSSKAVSVICFDGDVEVRLRGGPSNKEGRVEVQLGDGDWGGVCDFDFDNKDATVVCRQLNEGAKGMYMRNAQHGKPSVMHLDELDCDGTESNIGHCKHPGWKETTCSSRDAISVVCYDGDIEARLIGGPNSQEGRLEVRLRDGDWGSVCGKYFADREASVVCRQLNKGVSGKALKDVSYKPPPTTMHLDDVDCGGTEHSIGLCGNRGWGNKICEPHVGIRCIGGMSSTIPTTRSFFTSTSTAFPDIFSFFDNGVSSLKPTTRSRSTSTSTVLSSLKPTTRSRSTSTVLSSLKPTTRSSSTSTSTSTVLSSLKPTTRSSSTSSSTVSVETTTKPLTESSITDVLRNKTKSKVTEQTVAQTRKVLEQQANPAAADVVAVADIVDRASQLKNVSVQTARNLLKIVDSVAQLNQSVLHESNSVGNTTNRLIGAVEQLADKVSLEEGPVLLKTNTTVLRVWNLTAASQSPFLGLQLRSNGELVNGSSAVNNQSDVDTHADVEAAVLLPGDIGRRIVDANPGMDIRVSASVIKRTHLFRADERTGSTGTDTSKSQSAEGDGPTSGASLNSIVVSLRITVNGEPVTNLSAYGQDKNVTMVFRPLQHLDLRRTAERRKWTQCVFWDFALREGMGGWSTDGCYAGSVESEKVICLCNHLTNFAILMDLYGQEVKVDRVHDDLLRMISTVGLIFSICGLSLTLLAFILVKKLHSSLPQQTLFNTALAMLLSWVTFMAGIDRVEDHVCCVAVAMLLHYFILVTFLWMLAQAVLQYAMLVKVRKSPFTRYMLKAGLPAWGLPFLPVIIVSAINVELYRGGEKYCWMSTRAFYYAFLAPIAVIIAINVVIYVLVVVSICRRPNMSSGGTSYTAISVRASVSCFVVLGLSWTFAFFALEDARVVFQYLFACTTSFQGFLIFLLYTARDPNVRAFCLDKMRKRRDSSSGLARDRGSGPSGPRPEVMKSASTKETSFIRFK
ncbi:uncharacterized protein LOC143293704 [Babylonia areolata]|uniref:uncharacterized protein LOC143293704 n=1 Tax=Babylonia areolata TaxID=304850 RepID=UPI003FD40B4A